MFARSYLTDGDERQETVWDSLDQDFNLYNFDNTVTHFTKTLKSTVDYIWYEFLWGLEI
jgi:hypothetical protein